MPLEWVAIREAAQNQVVSGSLEWCTIVPAVTDVCLPQPAHSHVHGLVFSCHALLLPHSGQTKPSGQRAMKRYLTQAASSGKRCWNSIRERGNRSRRVTQGGLCSFFVLYQTAARRHNRLRHRTQRHKPYRAIPSIGLTWPGAGVVAMTIF